MPIRVRVWVVGWCGWSVWCGWGWCVCTHFPEPQSPGTTNEGAQASAPIFQSPRA